eukprot:EG_transcript_19659
MLCPRQSLRPPPRRHLSSPAPAAPAGPCGVADPPATERLDRRESTSSLDTELIDAPNLPSEKCRVWIETVLGEKLDSNMHTALKSGAVLCKLMNTIRPGSAPKWSTSAMPFPQRENIKLFLDAAERMRVSSMERFETQDLFDGKNMDNVFICIMAVADASRRYGFKGPFIEKSRAHRQR